MITFETTITGNEIGRKLRDDPEELAYALQELAGNFTSEDADELMAYLDPALMLQVAEFASVLNTATERAAGE
ncbi:hypothetical protein SAMN05421853_10287 [Roseivivax halotolerans]|uniref:Uncharacterized protein n=1 Tax=Roseivivax halotolerans TaxID=93684 RepID=A0A1I5W2J5_9RHOB|nr:hypothetical protein [Roseivivax halotolerans]SFQ13910.1 hypothetical protein SAMN05421853_10287 [Roseivivax halotolerans]